MMAALDDVLAAIGLCIQSEDDYEDRTAKVADLLLEFVGAPTTSGANTGSDAKIKAVADAAKERFNGKAKRFSFDYLRDLRRTAHRFTPVERSTAVPFSLMIAARDPKTLRDAMARAKQDNRKCSAGFIRKFRKVQENQNENEDNNATAFVQLQELQRRMIEHGHFYNRSAAKSCAAIACECSNEDRHALASAGRDLIRAVNHVVSAIEPSQMRQAAE
jgi:hypothetical protein